MLNTVKCDSCGADIEVSKAFVHQIEEQAKAETESQVRAAILKELEIKDRDRAAETRELHEAKAKLQTELLEMSKTMRGLKEAMDRQELDNAKKLNEERTKIKDEAMKIAMEKSHLETAELKKQLDDTKHALDSANYKLTQKSQQLQGEVLELDLEGSLRQNFPGDDINPVAKGRFGGDVIHIVKGKTGSPAGTILWETKRAVWTAGWVDKLKDDARDCGASFAILLSTNLPKDITSFAILPGRVIVAQHSLSMSMAAIVRRFVLEIAAAKQSAAKTDEQLQSLADYLTSDTFRHRFETFAEGVIEMQSDLEAEIRSTERLWKKRDMQIKKILTGASHIYGEMQGIMGQALPDIKSFSLPSSTISTDQHESAVSTSGKPTS